MSIRATLLLLTLLVVLLPLGVAAASWWGLDRLDREIGRISEEYEEARTLAGAETELRIGIALLGVPTIPTAVDEARRHFAAAEKLLLAYLEEQAVSTSSEEHQSDEFKAATSALGGLRRVLESGAAPAGPDRREIAQQVLDAVQAVRAVADEAVLAAQGEARTIERSTLESVLFTSLLTAAICAVVAIAANRAVMRSIRGLHRSVAARTDGVRPPRRADVGVVVSEIDALSERMHRELQEKNRELLRRERVAGIGLLAADVAHELRNPLNAMLGLTELSLRAASEGPLDGERRAEVQESLGVVRREVIRCREIVDRLMAMVRTRSAPTRLDANALLAESVQVARAARPDKAACFQLLRTGAPLWTTAPAQELRQILLTLLINAADAVKDDGRIEVDATASDTEVWFRVRDDGKGFEPARRLDRAVPFETTRAHEGGTGLGLSIAQSLAADIGAEIRCFSDGPGKGSLFLVAVPLREEAP